MLDTKAPDYKAMYYHLFNAITDAIQSLQAIVTLQADVVKALKNAQKEVEEMFISTPPTDVRVLRPGEPAEDGGDPKNE